MPFLLFTTSAAIMVIEILASRLVAPTIGTSVYTWTAVIGVIVTGVALGNLWGGKLADKTNPDDVISWALIRAALSIILVIVAANLAPTWRWLSGLPFQTRVLIHVTLIFIWPALFLGMVSPAIGKKILKQDKVGQSFGRTMSWGSLGAVFGTYLAGFVLIPLFGTKETLWFVGALLIVLGIAVNPKARSHWAFALIFLTLFAVAQTKALNGAAEKLGIRRPKIQNVVLETESPYSSFQVRTTPCSDSTFIFKSDGIVQSIVNTQTPHAIARPTRGFAQVLEETFEYDRGLSVLSIGGGAQAFSRYVVSKWKKSHIDIAEIDPTATTIAMNTLKLNPHDRISTHHIDGRIFVGRRAKKPSRNYDFIVNDSFRGLTVPFQLVTQEFLQSISTILSRKGLFVTNMPAHEKEFGLLSHYTSTIQSVFKHSAVYSLQGRRFGNFLVVASQSPLPETSLKSVPTRQVGILTDDYAPAEFLSRKLGRYVY